MFFVSSVELVKDQGAADITPTFDCFKDVAHCMERATFSLPV